MLTPLLLSEPLTAAALALEIARRLGDRFKVLSSFATLLDSAPAQILLLREPLTDALWEEALPLLEAHWQEIAHYLDIPLAPMRERYAALEADGRIRTYTARAYTLAADYQLVGYALFIVQPNAHYGSSLQAMQDVIYVAPAARGRTGYRFIAAIDEQLRAEGVQVVYHHVKQAHNFGPMLERLGYELVDHIYARRLDRAEEA